MPYQFRGLVMESDALSKHPESLSKPKEERDGTASLAAPIRTPLRALQRSTVCGMAVGPDGDVARVFVGSSRHFPAQLRAVLMELTQREQPDY